MTMQNPFGMGLDVMRQLGASQSQIAQTQGERQRQQMLQQKAAEQAALAEQQAMQQQQKDLWDLFGNLRKNLPDAQSRIQAIQGSPFAQIQGIEDLMNEQAMSDTGLDQLIAAAPFEQEQVVETQLVKNLRAAGIDPASEEGRNIITESIKPGQAAGLKKYDVFINNETGQPEAAVVDLVTNEVTFLGYSPVPSAKEVEAEQEAGYTFTKTGQFSGVEEASDILSSANATQQKAAGFANRLDLANQDLTTLERQIDPTGRAIRAVMTPSGDGIMGFFGSITDEAARAMLDPAEQQYVSAATEFVRAALRQESGAVIGADEFRDEVRKYFPMPGDSPEVIAAKAELRQRKVDEMAQQSGGAFQAQRFIDSQQAPTEAGEEGERNFNWEDLPEGQ